MEAPIPFEAPVTTATLPLGLVMTISPLGQSAFFYSAAKVAVYTNEVSKAAV